MNQGLVKEANDSLLSFYAKLYRDDNFYLETALPLISNDDISLEFINCTICLAKQNIKNNIIGKDYILFQPAIRTKNYNGVLDVIHQTRYASCFTMIGGYKYIKNAVDCPIDLERILLNEAKFLNHFFSQKVQLTIPEQYVNKIPISQDFISKLVAEGIKIIYSQDDMKKLKWKYGISGVEGFGIRWSIIEDRIINWGNTVVLYRGDSPIGIDFGGGLEILLQAYCSLPHCVYANRRITQQIADFICNQTRLKITDALVFLFDVFEATDDIESCSARIKYILNQYVRSLAANIIRDNISFCEFSILVESMATENLNSAKDYILMCVDKRIQELKILSSSKKVVSAIEAINNGESVQATYVHSLKPVEIEALQHLI